MQTTEEWRSVERKVDRLAGVVDRRAYGLAHKLDREDYRSMLMVRALEVWQRRQDLPEVRRKWYVNRAVENFAWDIHRRECYLHRGATAWQHGFPREDAGRDLESQYQATELLGILAAELTSQEWRLLMAAIQWEDHKAEDFCLEDWSYMRQRWSARKRAKVLLSKNS